MGIHHRRYWDGEQREIRDTGAGLLTALPLAKSGSGSTSLKAAHENWRRQSCPLLSDESCRVRETGAWRITSILSSLL